LSLDDPWAFFVKELMVAIGAEKLDVFVPELVPVTIKIAFALRARHPKDFSHGISRWERKF
jgi:hypothetical protein